MYALCNIDSGLVHVCFVQNIDSGLVYVVCFVQYWFRMGPLFIQWVSPSIWNLPPWETRLLQRLELHSSPMSLHAVQSTLASLDDMWSLHGKQASVGARGASKSLAFANVLGVSRCLKPQNPTGLLDSFSSQTNVLRLPSISSSLEWAYQGRGLQKSNRLGR
jgi:hypothetical protein